MVAMPLGRLVRLKGSERLLRKMRMISAEAQGDDGEIIAAQLERGRAQDHAEGARDGRADGQDRPPRQVQAEVAARRGARTRKRRQRRRRCSPVQQPRETDHDVSGPGTGARRGWRGS